MVPRLTAQEEVEQEVDTFIDWCLPMASAKLALQIVAGLTLVQADRIAHNSMMIVSGVNRKPKGSVGGCCSTVCRL
jgi:hypothetical protein